MPRTERERQKAARKEWLPGGRAWPLACEPRTVRRALGFAVVVGSLLIAINYGDRLLTASLDERAWLKMALTVLVPYCVSTLSTVGARLDAERTHLDSAADRA